MKSISVFFMMLCVACCAFGQPTSDYADLKAALSDVSVTRQATALRQLDTRNITAPEVDWLLACMGWKRGRLGRANVVLAVNSAYLLGCAGDSRAVPALIAGLGHRNGGMQYECLLALAKIGDKRAVPSICAYVNAQKGSKQARGAAGYALGVLGDPSAIPTLMTMAHESGRVFPAWDVLRIGAAAVDPLITALAKEQNPDPIWIFTLGELRAIRAVSLFKTLAARPDRKGHLTRAILFACRKINTPEARAILQSVAQQEPDDSLRKLAVKLYADANTPAHLPAQCPHIEQIMTSGTAIEREQTLTLLDRMIDSFDVDWRVKEQARAQAYRLRQQYRFTGQPQSWDSLIYVVSSVKTADGVVHTATPEEIATIRTVFDSFVEEVDTVSQGRLRLRLQYQIDPSCPPLTNSPDGVTSLPKHISKHAEQACKALGMDHRFMVWVVPEGVKSPPYSNGGSCSHIPVKRINGITICSSLGALHEMVHSMNNCLWSVGYVEGQMPNLHYGVAQILYQAKRLDGSTPERVREYLRYYFTGSMWASLSRTGDTGIEQPEEVDDEP